MAAKLLPTLMHTVKQDVGPHVEGSDTTLWRDNATALMWIKKAGEWKPCIQHRVKEISKLTDGASWQYCPSDCNPPDISSRGEKAAKLTESTLWKKGPHWLLNGKLPKALEKLSNR